MDKKLTVATFFRQLAEERGIDIVIEPEYGRTGQIKLPGGRKFYFKNSPFNLNMAGASEIARDKAYTSYFLKKMGYPTPTGETFFSDEYCSAIGSKRNPAAAYKYARSLGWPVIIKPNNKSCGIGVFKACNKNQFIQAVKAVTSLGNIFLVQKMEQGNDYRILVFDNEVICSYQRLALSVVGDGRSSVRQLLEIKKKEFSALGRSMNVSIDDERIVNHLKSQKLSLDSILFKETRAEILPNNNLSSGGDAIDTTDNMHPEWKKLAINVTRDLGLRYCGVDIISKGEIKEKPSSFVILELNASPGISKYALLGEKQKEIIRGLYKKIFEAIIRED